MLFQNRFHAGLADGSITLTFRDWASPRVKVGGQYRVHGVGTLEVTCVEPMNLGDATRGPPASRVPTSCADT